MKFITYSETHTERTFHPKTEYIDTMTADPSKTTVDGIIDLSTDHGQPTKEKEPRMLNARRALIVCLGLAALALTATGIWAGRTISQERRQLAEYRLQEQRAKEQQEAKEKAEVKAELEALKAKLAAAQQPKPAAPTPAPTTTVAPTPIATAPAAAPAAAPTEGQLFTYKVQSNDFARAIMFACDEEETEKDAIAWFKDHNKAIKKVDILNVDDEVTVPCEIKQGKKNAVWMARQKLARQARLATAKASITDPATAEAQAAAKWPNK